MFSTGLTPLVAASKLDAFSFAGGVTGMHRGMNTLTLQVQEGLALARGHQIVRAFVDHAGRA